MLDEFQVTGRARTHVVQLDAPRFAAPLDAAQAFPSLDLLARVTAASDLPGKARVLEMLPEILERHVRNIVPPPPERMHD